MGDSVDIVDVNTLFGPLLVASTDLNVDALAALMQKHNIAAACTLSTLGLLLDPALGNAATRAACAQYAGLLPVATLNPATFFGDTAAQQQLQKDDFCLIRFFPHAQGWPVEFGPFHTLLHAIAPLGLPIMVGIETPGEITALTRVLETYPAPVILSGVSLSTLAEAVLALQERDRWHVEISRLLAPGAIRQVADIAGADRLLFGTGAPSQPIAGVLATLQHAGLSEEARRQVLAANARRILQNSSPSP
ncbi:MAG TPA: amidohydrolase family protein [Chthonomonadaceae bacterium]|nr:amidohydrolase family protein [Chthonomonadaceae bacterium]